MSSATSRAIDPDVWESVYRTHASRLTRLATTLVGPHEAHDLVAETVLACIRRPDWATVNNHAAYLTTALVNTANGTRRRDAARRRREVAVTQRPVAEGTENMDDLSGTLEELSPTQAAIVHLLYWEDLTIPATAQHLGMSEGAVRKQLDRAKRRLRKAITHARL
jgi:RNA polymerase sigma factor (sigma-70 family)